MWLAFRTGVFTCFCIFQLKNLDTEETIKRIKKTKEEINKRVKDLIDEIAHQDIEIKAKNVKSSSGGSCK